VSDTSNQSVDLFVILARLGQTKGECDAAAPKHIEALSRGDKRAAGSAGHVLRERLEALLSQAAEAARLYDENRIDVFTDQLSPK
jgi:hypothetical protein